MDRRFRPCLAAGALVSTMLGAGATPLPHGLKTPYNVPSGREARKFRRDRRVLQFDAVNGASERGGSSCRR
jgi:hypothetical protein